MPAGKKIILQDSSAKLSNALRKTDSTDSRNYFVAIPHFGALHSG
jgi:hypothetical protein